MSQVPRQNHLLERIVLCTMIGVGLLLILINSSNTNVKLSIYGVFIIITSGIRLMALRAEKYNERVTVVLNWSSLVILVAFVLMIIILRI